MSRFGGFEDNMGNDNITLREFVIKILWGGTDESDVCWDDLIDVVLSMSEELQEILDKNPPEKYADMVGELMDVLKSYNQKKALSMQQQHNSQQKETFEGQREALKKRVGELYIKKILLTRLLKKNTDDKKKQTLERELGKIDQEIGKLPFIIEDFEDFRNNVLKDIRNMK